MLKTLGHPKHGALLFLIFGFEYNDKPFDTN